MKINFYLRYHTVFGEQLFLSGNNHFLGENNLSKGVLMQWINEDFWQISVDFPADFDDIIHYKYILKDISGNEIFDGEQNRSIDLSVEKASSYTIFDIWNDAADARNVFFTTAFSEVLLPQITKIRPAVSEAVNHIFRVKAPLLNPGETICMCGSTKNLKNWNVEDPIILTPKNNWYTARIFLEDNEWPASYKFGIYNLEEKRLVNFEEGENRILRRLQEQDKGMTILNEGFVKCSRHPWKGAGVSIPVFSLRSEKSFGVGEFSDIKLLIDWAKETGLQMIQLLPVNDTTVYDDWRDSYPYAAISAFALHPIYINLEKVAGKRISSILKPLKKKQKQLNDLKEFDYEEVMKFKVAALKELFELEKNELKNDPAYFEFFELNRHWLVPYAAFCFLKNKYKTADFTQWQDHTSYNEQDVQALVSPTEDHYDEILFFYFVQYHLHLQMKEVANYAHQRKIILKGDIPIGVSRFSCDAWVNPSLYNMDQQAGAPPDDFAVKGQNWGFPTYNWNEMSKDNYNWWRCRFDQMSNYFDAFRIDHILGFFRIWSIPIDSVEGIMGRFVPAIPVDISEFFTRGISFNRDRYCKPYITEKILADIFKDRAEEIKEKFLDDSLGIFELKDLVNTQAKVVQYFADKPDEFVKKGLFDLISNVILFEEENSFGQKFHFRIAIDKTSSFYELDNFTKSVLWPLYINYFFERQNNFWKKEGLKKLTPLKRNTNMLVCGEDLGMVPPCVPEVMKQLAILSLEIERMPKNLSTEFFHPRDAPYLSVVSPSTHDMSTIRGWWEENHRQTQRFYNYMLGQYGEAPLECTGAIVKKIILQHLYSPAMWSIFQLADLLGMDEKIRRQNPDEERINIPSDPHHYWHYRMHLNLETLLKEKEFNEELKNFVFQSARIQVK